MKDLIETFKDSNFRVIEQDGRKYMSAVDVAKYLEYKNEYVQANHFVKRNKEILDGEVTILVTTSKQGKRVESYYLSLEGVLMFLVKTNQKKAITFQKWVKDTLAKSVQSAQIPEKTAVRIKSKQVRNAFTDTLKSKGVSKPYEYIQLTYATKEGVGIDRDKKKDQMSIFELLQISMSESLSTYNIEMNDPNGYYEIKPIVQDSALDVKELTEKQSTKKQQISECKKALEA
jgi:prophage antirepressor-like protein